MWEAVTLRTIKSWIQKEEKRRIKDLEKKKLWDAKKKITDT